MKHTCSKQLKNNNFVNYKSYYRKFILNLGQFEIKICFKKYEFIFFSLFLKSIYANSEHWQRSFRCHTGHCPCGKFCSGRNWPPHRDSVAWKFHSGKCKVVSPHLACRYLLLQKEIHHVLIPFSPNQI